MGNRWSRLTERSSNKNAASTTRLYRTMDEDRFTVPSQRFVILITETIRIYRHDAEGSSDVYCEFSRRRGPLWRYNAFRLDDESRWNGCQNAGKHFIQLWEIHSAWNCFNTKNKKISLRSFIMRRSWMLWAAADYSSILLEKQCQ